MIQGSGMNINNVIQFEVSDLMRFVTTLLKEDHVDELRDMPFL